MIVLSGYIIYLRNMHVLIFLETGNVEYRSRQIYLQLHSETLTTLHRSAPPSLH